MHPELVTKDINARSIVTFFNSISSLQSFEASLPLIQMIGEGSVGTEFSSLFVMFINNKLDKMISPNDILFKDEKYVLDTLKGLVGRPKDNAYRADIAATLSIRLINYSLFYANDNSKKIDKAFVDRISKIITEEIFTTDICYNIVKMIYNGNPNQFKAFTMNNALVKYIMK
jgi:hypothetical protein